MKARAVASSIPTARSPTTSSGSSRPASTRSTLRPARRSTRRASRRCTTCASRPSACATSSRSGRAVLRPIRATAIKRTKELQDLLGEMHDCDVAAPARARRARTSCARPTRSTAAPRAPARPTSTRRSRRGPPHAAAWRGLDTLSIYVEARRGLLFERFLELWRELEREGFRARLEYAIGERPARRRRLHRLTTAQPRRRVDLACTSDEHAAIREHDRARAGARAGVRARSRSTSTTRRCTSTASCRGWTSTTACSQLAEDDRRRRCWSA